MPALNTAASFKSATPATGQLRRLRRTLSSTNNRHSSPLATKLLRLVFGLYFGVAMLTTLTHLLLEFRNEKQSLDVEVQETIALVMPVLATAIWNLDTAAAKATMDALRERGAITGVALSGDLELSVGAVPGERHIVAGPTGSLFKSVYGQSFPIDFVDKRGERKHIAVLSVYSTADVVIERSTSIFYTTIVSALVKTVFLWLILHTVFKLYIAAPIEKLALRLNRVNRELARAHELNDAPIELSSQSDEMRFLLRSFINMRKALRRSHRDLMRYQQELEAKVEERTAQLHYRASHDDLTGLLNRRAFEDRLAGLLRDDSSVVRFHALCFVDLDYFKLVNDTLGHAAGDAVLSRVGELLRAHTRPEDIVARIGGDEFAVVLKDCATSDATKILEKLRSQVEALVVDERGHKANLGMSAGMLLIESNCTDTVAMCMSKADAACYSAKHGGRNQIQIYDGKLASKRRRYDVNWVQLINRALNEDLFALYFQAIVDAGADPHAPPRHIEILLRMNVEGEVIVPGAFMPSAERYKLAGKIDRWVVDATLRYLSENPVVAEGLESIHINLSAPTLSSVSFYRHVVRLFRRYEVPFSKVCFEVTETATLSDIDRPVRIMQGLRRRGVKFALDDFGKGMASHAYLRDLPVDQVKIDGSFVRNLREDPVSHAVVQSVTKIAHQMGKTTVAECVEDLETAECLRALGLDFIQGYCYSRPTPIQTLLTPIS